MAIDLLKTETDATIIASLKEMTFDVSIDGTEAQKNAQLAPAPAVPAIDREIAEAHGKQVGFQPLRPDGSPSPEQPAPKEAEQASPNPQPAAGAYRAVSQDEMMGYTDEFVDEEPDDDDVYF
jgi:hypothetical protein